MTITEAKNEYNKSLARFYNAEEYFERKDISQEDKEKFLPILEQVLNDLNYYLSKINNYTNKEMLEGFNRGK